MKALIIFSSIAMLTFASCIKKTEKKEEAPPKKTTDYYFEAQVIGRNFDCNLYDIEILSHKDSVVKLITYPNKGIGTYTALNLPEELKRSGLKISLHLRNVLPEESYPCTSVGPAYPWIYVLEAKEKL